MATIAGRYEIIAKLGEGGMGVVFRAYDPPPMDREVAVKTLHEFADPLALELFYKECSALKSISHPNIVEIFDMGEFNEDGHKKPFFVMPLLPGQTLDKLIRSASHRLTVDRVVEIFAQTCRGLQAAHEQGLVHRDLKPSNIFVLADDSVKLIDFGVAHAVSVESRSTGFDKGTLLYMAPEQIQHKPVSVQSDIYSLGVTLYEALTRRQPFRAGNEEAIIRAIQTHIPPPASELNPAVSHVISRVVHKAMAKPPWGRFDTAREFGDTLQKAARNEPIAIFDPARTQPRIQTATKALEKGDYQFAGEIVGELEAEGNIDPQITLLRTEIDQMARHKTIAQLLESARARYEEEEDPLALSKLQEVLQLDPTNVVALGLKSKIEDRRSERQIEKWIQLARQHVDNHSYSHAREALQNALVLRPRDSRAARLLKEIEREEQEYVRLRREKTEIYQAAVNAWKNGEVSQALSQMRLVLDLDRRAPDASSPDAAGAYQTFYNKIQSEHDAIANAYAEARHHLVDKEFARALHVCRDFLAKYPGHALFQALKFDIEEQQRQQLSAFIAEIDRRLEAEPDLEAKVALVREALADYPDEEHFKRLAAVLGDKRDLVNSIIERARLHEGSGQIAEALGDLDTLQTIYSIYPGLSFEKSRLQKRLEQQTRDAARAKWVRQIDAQLEAGNYRRAADLLDMAESEFVGDAELVELRKLATQGRERTRRADQLVAEGQELCAQGHFEQGVDLLKIALELDDRSAVRMTLRDLFVARAQEHVNADWRTVEAFADRALELDPNHALAKSLRARASDRKREEEVPLFASQARRLQAAGDIAGAMAEVERGLAAYPGDPRLGAIVEALKKESSRPVQTPAVARPAPAPVLEAAAPPAPELDRTRLVPERHVVQTPDSEPPSQAADPVIVPATEPVPVPRPVVSPRLSEPTTSPLGKPTRPRPLPWKPIAATAAAAAIVVVVVLVLQRRPAPDTPEPVATSPALATPEPSTPLAVPPVADPVVAAPILARLSLRQLPPGAQVSLDGVLIGTIAADGTLAHADISSGRHTILVSAPGYAPVNVSRDFAAEQTLELSKADVALTRLPGHIEVVADTDTEVTVARAGSTVRTFKGSTALSLPEGTYAVTVKGPAGIPTTRTLSVSAGSTETMNLRAMVVTGMERFDLAGWMKADNWFTRKGGAFVLYDQANPDGKFTFTIRLDRSGNPFSTGARLKWAVAYINNNTHVLLQLDKDAFYRSDVINPDSPVVKIPHRIPTNVPFIHLSAQVSGSRLIHQFSVDGSTWQTLDNWNRTTSREREAGRRTPLDGRFAFYLPGNEEMFVSNFLYYPPSQ